MHSKTLQDNSGKNRQVLILYTPAYEKFKKICLADNNDYISAQFLRYLEESYKNKLNIPKYNKPWAVNNYFNFLYNILSENKEGNEAVISILHNLYYEQLPGSRIIARSDQNMLLENISDKLEQRKDQRFTYYRFRLNSDGQVNNLMPEVCLIGQKGKNFITVVYNSNSEIANIANQDGYAIHFVKLNEVSSFKELYVTILNRIFDPKFILKKEYLTEILLPYLGLLSIHGMFWGFSQPAINAYLYTYLGFSIYKFILKPFFDSALIARPFKEYLPFEKIE